MIIESSKLLHFLRIFEETVYLHTKYIDKCRKIILLKSGSMDRYISRLRKLRRISEKLQKILQDILSIVNDEVYDSEAIEKLELLLFYINEIAIPSEREIWRRLGDMTLAVVGLDINEQLSRIDKIEMLSKSIYNTIVNPNEEYSA